MQTALIVALVAYLVVMFGIGFWAKSQIHSDEDFIVAGRRLPLSLSIFTLLATWFGAGTMLTATDEIKVEGLRASALEPYGAGLALILAGLFFAGPLWKEKVCTMADFYRKKFGPRVETAAVFLTVPAYAGWIAVQLISLAGIMQLFYDVPLNWGILFIAIVAMIYTLMGGMWSVTVTDAVQLLCILVGVAILGYEVFTHLGAGDFAAGFDGAMAKLTPQEKVLVPRETLREFHGWLTVFLVASLGNIPGQDLGQRIFSAKSAGVARNACLIAGVMYVTFGTVPVFLGLAAKHVLPDDLTEAVIPALAKTFLSPAMTVVFILAIFSVVLSTIDSAILAPASTLARNGLRRILPASVSTLRLCQISVVFMTVFSLVIAYSGERAYSLLEGSYSVGFVALFTPLVVGVYARRPNERSVLWAMVVGSGLWLLEFVGVVELPMAAIAAAASLATYFVHERVETGENKGTSWNKRRRQGIID